MIRINTWTTSTRTYVTEHAQIVSNGYELGAEGRDKWLNRPWYKFRYQNAIMNALRGLKQYSKEQLKEIYDLNSIDDIVDYLNKED